MNEIEMKEKLEDLLKDFDCTPKYQVEVMGKKIDVPVKYSDASAFMVFLPISLEKSTGLIKNARIKPVSILSGKCAIGITLFDYLVSPVGPYREIAVSIPVTLDSKISIPFLPFIFDSLFGKFGFYTIFLAMNTDIARLHSEKIFGYPTYRKKIEINLKCENNYINIDSSEHGEKIISLRIKSPDNFKVVRKKYNTYITKGDKIINVELQAATCEANSIKKEDLILELGKHEIARFIKELSVLGRSLKSIYYKKAIEILGCPKEI